MGRDNRGMGSWEPDIREGAKIARNIKDIRKNLEHSSDGKPKPSGNIARAWSEITDIGNNLSDQS